jgi:hypothetical protein
MIDGASVNHIGRRNLVLVLAAEMSHPDIDGLLKGKLRNAQVWVSVKRESPAVDDVQSPLISGIFGRTEILSTLDLSSGFMGHEEAGHLSRERSAFSRFTHDEVEQPRGGTARPRMWAQAPFPTHLTDV